LYHYESLSRGSDEDLYKENPQKYRRVMDERSYMLKRWQKVIDSDPYYNPNLTLRGEDLSLRI
jgi:O-antigen biosynthesis protein